MIKLKIEKSKKNEPILKINSKSLDENGFLQVKRKYIVEPKPISVHLLWAKEERMRLLRQRENL